ncbi:MAG: hypothetical protein JNL72_02600 [Flavipsychrobacter sp.]|nr:hypothetical protein [Flavipsychrobacter sp.]
MKKAMLIAAISFLSACNSDSSQKDNQTATEKTPSESTQSARLTVGRTQDTTFVNKDTANRMIESYLQSISAPVHQNSMASMIINADSLRAYLSDTSIHKMKVMFAHTRNYMNNGNFGQYCGTTSGQLTLIFSGFDENDNYKFFDGNEVMNNCKPCPTICPVNGTAQYNTFPSP